MAQIERLGGWGDEMDINSDNSKVNVLMIEQLKAADELAKASSQLVRNNIGNVMVISWDSYEKAKRIREALTTYEKLRGMK